MKNINQQRPPLICKSGLIRLISGFVRALVYVVLMGRHKDPRGEWQLLRIDRRIPKAGGSDFDG